MLRDEDVDIGRHQATGLVHPPKRRMKFVFSPESYG